MGRKSRIPWEQKEWIVQEYLAGEGSYQTLEDKYQVEKSVLRDWVRKYQLQGAEGLRPQKRNQTYSAAFKEQVVREYLEEGLSYRALAIKYQLPAKETIRKWVLQYTRGKEIKGYDPQAGVYTMEKRKTTFEERVAIVRHCLDHELNYKETAAKYQVPYSQVYHWVRKYREHGEEGLRDHRGKGKPAALQTEEEKLRAQNQALEARLQWLEMENEVLKKRQEIERRLTQERSSGKKRRTKRSKK